MNKLGMPKVYECVNATCNQYPDFKMPRVLLKQYVTEKPFEFKYAKPEATQNVA